MEWNEWNDGDADDPEATHNRDFEPWPPAPLPPHERTWRHPSELGATTVHVVAPPPAGISRKATAATVAVGVLLVAGAVRLMIPASGASTGATDVAGLTIVTSGVGRVTTVAASGATPAPTASDTVQPQVSAVPTFESVRITTTLATPTSASSPGPGPEPSLELTMLQTEVPTYAVVLTTGRYLATSASAVDGMDTVRVQMPSGDMADAQVIHADGPIALLDLTSQTAAAGPHAAPPDQGATVTVSAPGGPVPATVGEGNEHGYRQLISDQPLHESGPVFDDEGAVVGICTRMHDAAWLVPVLLLDELAAQQPEDPVTTSVPTSTTPETSTSVPPSTSTTSTTSTTTSSTSTSTTSTTSTTTSTTPTTAPPATTEPQTVG